MAFYRCDRGLGFDTSNSTGDSNDVLYNKRFNVGERGNISSWNAEPIYLSEFHNVETNGKYFLNDNYQFSNIDEKYVNANAKIFNIGSTLFYVPAITIAKYALPLYEIFYSYTTPDTGVGNEYNDNVLFATDDTIILTTQYLMASERGSVCTFIDYFGKIIKYYWIYNDKRTTIMYSDINYTYAYTWQNNEYTTWNNNTGEKIHTYTISTPDNYCYDNYMIIYNRFDRSSKTIDFSFYKFNDGMINLIFKTSYNKYNKSSQYSANFYHSHSNISIQINDNYKYEYYTYIIIDTSSYEVTSTLVKISDNTVSMLFSNKYDVVINSTYYNRFNHIYFSTQSQGSSDILINRNISIVDRDSNPIFSKLLSYPGPYSTYMPQPFIKQVINCKNTDIHIYLEFLYLSTSVRLKFGVVTSDNMYIYSSPKLKLRNYDTNKIYAYGKKIIATTIGGLYNVAIFTIHPSTLYLLNDYNTNYNGYNIDNTNPNYTDYYFN